MAGNPTRNVNASPGRDARDFRPAPRAISKNRIHPYSKDNPDLGPGWTIREICGAHNWPKGLEGEDLGAGVHSGKIIIAASGDTDSSGGHVSITLRPSLHLKRPVSMSR
jgi:hypothetical protein